MTSAADYDAVRDWVGDSSDDLIPPALARSGGDPEKAALSILRRRYNDLGVTKFAVAGDYSQDGTGQAEWIARQITRLERLTGDTAAAVDVAAVTVGFLTRCDTDR